MKTLVYQAQEAGCGYACVKMALIHKSGQKVPADLFEPEVDQAPSLSDLIAYGKTYGLSLRGYRCASRAALLQTAELPVILVLNEGGKTHAVLLQKRSGTRYVLLDPSRGRRVEDGERLGQAFSGVYLRIESYSPEGVHLEADPRFVSRISISFRPFLALLPAISALAFVGLLFLFIPALAYGAILLSLSLEGLGKYLSLRAMALFDAKYMSGVDDSDPSHRKERFLHYHAYKRAAFGSFPEVLGRLFSLGAALMICFCLSPLLGAIFLVACAVFSLALIPLERVKSRLERLSECLEAEYLSSKEENPVSSREELCRKGQRYGLFVFLEEGIKTLLAVTVGVMAYLFCDGDALLPVYAGFLAYFWLRDVMELFRFPSLFQKARREERYFRFHFL